MADDKKTNLPTVIKNLPSTEVSRRDFLRGLSGTVAQGVLDTIPTGRLIDLVTKNDKPFVNEGKIVRDLALLTKEIQSTMDQFNYDPNVQKLSKQTVGWLPDSNEPDRRYADPNQYSDTRRNHLLVNPEAYSKEIKRYIKNLDVNFYESGAYSESWTDPEAGLYHQEFENLLSMLSKELKPLEKEYANKLQELKKVITDKYGEKIAEDFFNLEQSERLDPIGWAGGKNVTPIVSRIEVDDTLATILDDAVEGLIVKDMYPDEDDSEGWGKIHSGGYYEEYKQSAWPSIIESNPERIQDRIESLSDRISSEKAKKEISVKDLGTAVGTELLQRTLTNLALPKKPKDKKEIKAPEQKQKQIQSSKTDSSQMNKLLTALSMVKKHLP